MIEFWFLFGMAFIGTHYAMPKSIRKLAEKNFLVRDMYKADEPLIPTNAGMIVVFSSFLSIALLPLIIRLFNQITFFEATDPNFTRTNLSFLLVVSIYAFYGLVDDLLDIQRKSKVLFPVVFGYPLIVVLNPETIWLPFIGDYNLEVFVFNDITRGDVFRITIIPIYIMVVSNLVNMHSGYNGLQSGLSAILILTLILKSWQLGILDLVIPAGAFLGSIFSFWIFNKFPAKVFEGNVGSMLFGSVIGCIIVINELWWFGFYILIPHTINFLLWIRWLVLIWHHPSEYLDNGNHTKFGKVRGDGSLKVPNNLTLKWIPNYYMNIGEKSSTNIMYSLTIFFCITGLLFI